MIQDKLTDIIQYAVQGTFGFNLKSSEIEISKPSQKEHGDFATNVSFKLAKKLKKAPKEIAEALADNLAKDLSFSKVEAVNGFVNFFLAKNNYHSSLQEILDKKENYADLGMFSGKKVQVEYLSANPTGPMHIGNARGIVGEAIANVFKKAGATVETEFYVNDVGGQANKFAATLLYWYKLSLAEKVDFPEGGYPGDFYKDLSAVVVLKIGKDKLADTEETRLLETFRKTGIEESMRLIKETVERLDVSFDKYVSQEDVNKDISPKVFDTMMANKQIVEKDGAKWFAGAEEGDNEYVLERSDENSTLTYFMDDIAYHWDKFCNRKFDLVVDVWGSNHYGHILRMKKAMEAIGVNPDNLQIALYQYVRLKKGDKIEKMAKRQGTYVTADQVLAEVPSDVFKFFLLMRSLNTHLDFDFELAKDTSEKNPVYYVKYAYARLSGILRNAKKLELPKGDITKLEHEAELELIDQLSQLPSVISSILMFEGYPVHYLTFYAIDTARKFHAFYDKCRCIDEEDLEMTAARLKLVEATKIVLSIVLVDLIGIEAPERM